MPGASGQCPNCTSSTLGFAKKRGTYKCWTCSYEAEDDGTHAQTSATAADALALLCPDSVFPRTLTGNQRTTIARLINQLLAGEKRSHLVHLVWEYDLAAVKEGIPKDAWIDPTKGMWHHEGYEYGIGESRTDSFYEHGELIGIFDTSDPKQLGELVSIGQRILKEQCRQKENPPDPWAKMHEDE